MIKKMICFENDFNFLESQKRDFIIVESSNTKRIKVLDSLENKKIFYCDKKMNNKVHTIVKKLKSELSPFLSQINEFMKDKKGNYYYSNSNLGDFCAKKVYNIDISSAYLTALFNAKFISQNLFNEIFDLQKKDRLICLGLLAYQPVHFYYKNGQMTDLQVIKNDFRNFFFYCVYEISEIIKAVVSVLGDSHIFSWVDGVYFFENDFLKEIVENEFKKLGYSTKFEILDNFLMKSNKNHFEFEFSKDKEIKCINVPNNQMTKKIEKGRVFSKFIEKPNFENALNYFNFK